MTRALVAFIATARSQDAIPFYRDVLGLELVEETPFAAVLRSGTTVVRLQKVEALTPQPFTALGWDVSDLRAALAELRRHGVSCERYGFMQQDDDGVWAAPGGALVAWFKDPDGNLLSYSQPPTTEENAR